MKIAAENAARNPALAMDSGGAFTLGVRRLCPEPHAMTYGLIPSGHSFWIAFHSACVWEPQEGIFQISCGPSLEMVGVFVTPDSRRSGHPCKRRGRPFGRPLCVSES